MLNDLAIQYASQLKTLTHLSLIINAILNFIFAGAVAKDAGKIEKLGHNTALVSPSTWAFATLIGGVITASIYWFIHHSTLTRPTREHSYD